MRKKNETERVHIRFFHKRCFAYNCLVFCPTYNGEHKMNKRFEKNFLTALKYFVDILIDAEEKETERKFLIETIESLYPEIGRASCRERV